MGLVYANITLKNPRYPELKPLEVLALVDTGSITMCIPEHIAVQLKLEEYEIREATLVCRLTQSFTDKTSADVYKRETISTLAFKDSVAFSPASFIGDSGDATQADGKSRKVSYSGPLVVYFDNRISLGGAMVMGDEVILGAIQMEDMDLVVHPRDQTLTVNPANPNMAKMIVK